jgi:hypothetical protein
MKEGEAPPVDRIEPALEIVPVVNFVHGLVLDDFLQDVGRRRPVDAPQHQEIRG